MFSPFYNSITFVITRITNQFLNFLSFSGIYIFSMTQNHLTQNFSKLIDTNECFVTDVFDCNENLMKFNRMDEI